MGVRDNQPKDMYIQTEPFFRVVVDKTHTHTGYSVKVEVVEYAIGGKLGLVLPSLAGGVELDELGLALVELGEILLWGRSGRLQCGVGMDM